MILSNKLTENNKEFTLTLSKEYKLEEPQTNFKIAYNYVYKNLNEKDLVISVTTGLIPADYYLKEKFDKNRNYDLSYKFLKNNEGYIAKKEGEWWYEGYTGSKVITNPQELKKVLESREGSIWIILDHQKVNHIDKGMGELFKKMTHIQEASDSTIDVYYSKNNNF